MTESYGFQESMRSCKLSEKSASPSKKNKYTCYECAGLPDKLAKCNTCRGLKYVNDNNVLAGLLLQVMCCKLGKDVPTIKKFPVL